MNIIYTFMMLIAAHELEQCHALSLKNAIILYIISVTVFFTLYMYNTMTMLLFFIIIHVCTLMT